MPAWIPVSAARSFIVNFFKGKQAGEQLGEAQLDRNVYEPYLPQSGAGIDEEYRTSGFSLYTVETHMRNLDEAGLGDEAEVPAAPKGRSRASTRVIVPAEPKVEDGIPSDTEESEGEAETEGEAAAE